MIHNPHLNYRPDIDGLRALAILLVIIFHAYPHFLRGGFIGVDIFFVISGYLISSIILKGLNQGNFSLVDFYSRRIKRIFPALIVVLSFCLISGWYVLLADEYQLLGKHIAGSSVYISNFILENESGYFDTEAEKKLLLHLWSLSIEEQFYLLFPVLLITVFRFNIKPALVIFVLFIASFLNNIFHIENNPTKVFYYPDTRAWELLIGSLVAYINLYLRYEFDAFSQRILLKRTINKDQALANLLSWFGFALIIIAWFGFNHEKILFPGNWALIPAIAAACLILAGEKAWLNQRIFSNKIAVFIGLISYPLYLWHWPLLSFTRIVQMENPSSSLRFLILVLSGILAWLTYFFIEKKLRYRQHWIVVVGLLTSLISIGVLGLLIKQQNGYPNRFYYSNQLTEEIGLKSWEAHWVKQKTCLNQFGEYQFCLLQNNTQPITAILIGDSHANHLYPGLIQNISLTGGNLLNLGMGGCLNFLNHQNAVFVNEDKHCQSFADKALEIAISTPSIKTVILGGSWGGYLQQKNTLRQRWKKALKNTFGLTEKDVTGNFQESMRETLHTLINAKKQVIFVMDIPALDFNPTNCFERPWRISGELVKKPCAILKANVNLKAQEYNEPVMQELANFPQVRIWSPSHAFCDKLYCWAIKEGKILYRDDDHLNEAGSLYLGKYFASQ